MRMPSFFVRAPSTPYSANRIDSTSVDFPAPFGPTTPITRDGSSRSTSSNTR